MMAEVFEEPNQTLSDAYLDALLSRTDFWAMAALLGQEVVGGITAHALPMTRAETTELFIYDVAVHADHQRRGVGRSC
jgi:aminoglycoside 3-N-acetyltransferase I